jgi:hypothetical protein
LSLALHNQASATAQKNRRMALAISRTHCLLVSMSALPVDVIGDHNWHNIGHFDYQ